MVRPCFFEKSNNIGTISVCSKYQQPRQYLPGTEFIINHVILTG